VTLHRRASAPPPAGDGRTLEVRLLPYDPAGQLVTDDGRSWYREAFERGTVTLAERVLVTLEHGGPIIGRLLDTFERADGLYATLRIADTGAGRDALALEADGIVPGVSVVYESARGRALPDELVVVTDARIVEVALTVAPQHDAPVLARRSTPPTTDVLEEADVDTDPNPNPNPDDEPDELEPAATTTEEEPTVADDPTTDDDPTPEEHHRSAPTPRGGATARPRPQFATFGHYARAVALGEVTAEMAARYQRALTDVTTADVAGLVPDGWVREVIDLIRSYTPTVEAFRSAPLPATGMVVSQPIVGVRPLVGKVNGEKVEIPSRKPTVLTASWDVETFAGGNDVSIQAITRSEPELLNELMRLYATDMAQLLNADMAAKVEAAADDVNAAVPITPATLLTGFTAAAKAILAGLRRFPEVAVIGVDVWEAMANAVGTDGRPLFPGLNPVNPLGSVQITDGTGNVRGLTLHVDPDLTDTVAIVGVREAAVSRRSGMATMTADVPSKLGRDVAVYQLAAQGATDARGLVKLTMAATRSAK
jgi:HK97 family phage major capsid protein